MRISLAMNGLGAATLAVASAAAPATAQAQQQTVVVSGQAGQMCVLEPPEQGEGPLDNFNNPSGSVFTITELADPTTLTTRAARITVSMEAMCTSLHRVEVASDGDGLWRVGGSSTPSGFADAVPYRADLLWADETNGFDAQGDTRQVRRMEVLVGRPALGDMMLQFEIQAGETNAGFGAPLVAGEYSDVLRVTVEAQ